MLEMRVGRGAVLEHAMRDPVPLAYHRADWRKRVSRGAVVLLCAFGAGAAVIVVGLVSRRAPLGWMARAVGPPFALSFYATLVAIVLGATGVIAGRIARARHYYARWATAGIVLNWMLLGSVPVMWGLLGWMLAGLRH
jgi:hypothetical protein